MPPDVQAHILPVWTVLVGAVVGFAAVLVTLVKGGFWLRDQVKEIALAANAALLHSDDFGKKVSGIVSTSLQEFASPLLLRLSTVEEGLRAAHRRLLALEKALVESEKEIAKLQGRVQSTRATDT